MGLVGSPRLNADLGDAADRGQRFAAKTKRADAEQIIGAGELAGRVAGKGEGQIFRKDAAAVVDDTNQLRAPLFDVDVNAAAAGIDRVFQEFLDDAGGPLDDLSGGNLGDDGGR